jgi:hypothetical protein
VTLGGSIAIARTSALAVVLALGAHSLVAGAPPSPQAWTPPAAGSPLRPIWSFDTKG